MENQKKISAWSKNYEEAKAFFEEHERFPNRKDKSDVQNPNNSQKLQGQQACIINMPELNGDTQISAGQAALMLLRMGIENNLTYSAKLKHSFMVELLSSMLDELRVTPEEIIRYRESEDSE